MAKGSRDIAGSIELLRREYGSLKGKFWHFSDAGDEAYVDLMIEGEVGDDGFLKFQIKEIDGGRIKQVIAREIGTEVFPVNMGVHQINLGEGVPEWVDSLLLTVKGTGGAVSYSLIRNDDGVFELETKQGGQGNENIGEVVSMALESTNYDASHKHDPIEVGSIIIHAARGLKGDLRETIEINVDGIPAWPWLEGEVVSPNQLTPEDQSQINQIVFELADAINDKDIERVSALSLEKIKVASMALDTSIAAQKEDFRSFMTQIVFSGGFETSLPLADLDYENVNDRVLRVTMNGGHPIVGTLNGPETGSSEFALPIFVSKINNTWTLVR